MSRDLRRRDLAPVVQGHPTPYRFLEEGERLHFTNFTEDGVPFEDVFVVPRTLRLDEAGRLAAARHMRESLDFTKPATSQRPRWERDS